MIVADMESSLGYEDLARVVRALRSALDGGDAPLPLPAAADPEVVRLYNDLLHLREFALAVSRGDLGQRLTLRGYTAGALKAIQANLSHLTWQSQCIAEGDFSQRLDCMGELSHAFNAMLNMLDQNRQQLQENKEELRRTNRHLLAEIAKRASSQQRLYNSQQRYRSLAMRDSLSQLYNRRFFFLLAKREVARAQRNASCLSLMLFDIDHFKRINDSFGHTAGDAVIATIGALTASMLRNVDIAGRYGGEEFVVLLPDCAMTEALRVAQRLRQAIADKPMPLGNQPQPVTASFGVAELVVRPGEHPSRQAMLDQLVEKADAALYRAKEQGRNRVEMA